ERGRSSRRREEAPPAGDRRADGPLRAAHGGGRGHRLLGSLAVLRAIPGVHSLPTPAGFLFCSFFPFFSRGHSYSTNGRNEGAVSRTVQLGSVMKKMLVSVVAAASLAIPVGWVSAASATPTPDPDANGDLHSNCHTGSKGRGAGGEDGGPGNP